MKYKSSLRWPALLVLLLFIVPILASCGSADTPAQAPTKSPPPTKPPEPTEIMAYLLTGYTHSSDMFSISYPTGWAVEEDDSGVTIHDSDVSLVINVKFDDLGRTLDSTELMDYIDYSFETDLAEQYESLELFEAETQEDGSVLVEYTFDMTEDTQAYGASFFEQHGAVMYTIAFMAMDAKEWDDIVDTFNEVANSFYVTRYIHSSGRFSISSPTGWTVEEDDSGVTIHDPDFGLVIVVAFYDLGRILDSTELMDYIDYSFETGLAEQYEDLELFEAEIQEDGSILVEYAFDATEDTQAYGGSFFEQHGTVMYTIAFMAMDAEEWDDVVDTFNEVANSFQVSADAWSTLSSAVGGYEIDYPSDWEAFELDGDAFISKDDETFLLIMISTTLPVEDPDEANRISIEEIMESIREDDPDAQIDGPDDIPIGGEEGLYADFEYIDPDTGLENSGTVVTVVHEGRGYRFLLFTLTEDFEENAPLFVDMLVSFRFVN